MMVALGFASRFNRRMLQAKLAELKIELPKVPGPFGAYIPAKRVGNLIYVSGQLPMKDGVMIASGTLPNVSLETAQSAARQCVINGLAAAATLPGGVEQITGVVRVGVFVASEAGFTQQPQVANAASELLLSLLGEAGKHARAAVGVPALPLGAAVEIEFIFEAK